MEQEPKHFVGKIAQKAVITKDGKVLLARFGDQKWDIPGGRLHRGEQPKEGLTREIKEELGVDVVVREPFFIDMTRAELSDEHRYFVAFNAVMRDPEAPFVFQKEEVSEVYWIGPDEVESKPLFEVCRRALHAYFAQQ